MSTERERSTNEGGKIKTVCAVPGCHRWTRRFPAGWEYLCPDHWKAVPAAHRRAYDRAMRKRGEIALTADIHCPVSGKKGLARVARLWRACVRKAILRAGGLI